jgi:uridine monophosphate synthetase
MKNLINELHRIEALRQGDFTLKSGKKSPVYLDLRLIVSFPKLLARVSDLMGNFLKSIDCDLLCGVPYTALPIATAMSLQTGVPMVFRRKEAKDYGRKRIIEGAYSEGQTCVIIEDLVTTGSSVLETAKVLEEEGLVVKDVIVLVDRQEGGEEALNSQGYQLHSILKLKEIINATETVSC